MLQKRGHLCFWRAPFENENVRTAVAAAPCPRYRSQVIDHCWDCGLARKDLAFTELPPGLQLLCGDCRHNRSAYETELESRACGVCWQRPVNRPGWQVSVCSPHCERVRHNRRRRLGDHGVRICAAPNCEDTFYAIRSDHLFCSPACQKRAVRKLGPVAKRQTFTPTEAEPF